MLLRKVRYYKFLRGRLMVAQSGTGKTATFSISILQTINTTQRETQALVLSPTRELATQIQSVILALGEYLNVPPQTLSQSLSPHILLSYFPRILSSHILTWLGPMPRLHRRHQRRRRHPQTRLRPTRRLRHSRPRSRHDPSPQPPYSKHQNACS